MKAHGFTLIELLITVAIVALLATIALPLAEISVQRAKEQDLRHALREIRGAIDSYKRASEDGWIERAPDKSGYPPTLAVLAEGVKDIRSPSGAKIYFLRRIPRDPFADTSEAPESTWGVRSYASTHDDPRGGADVYDVFSRNTGTGLNAIQYKDW
jgi:general secretion pathway protein G